VSVGRWLRDGVLRNLFGSKPHLLSDLRFCVLDIDVTGTSIRRDKVTGIAVLPVVAGGFRIADLRYFRLAEASVVPAPAGSAGQSVTAALQELITGSSVVTYNAHFVRQMILHADSLAGLSIPQSAWIDLELAAGVVASEEEELTTMGYWLERMRAGGERLHDARYDVFTIAQMLEALLSYFEEAGVETLEALREIQAARAWLWRR
jgi:DNA polymerase III alpha subunit (gram-positive type)